MAVMAPLTALQWDGGAIVLDLEWSADLAPRLVGAHVDGVDLQMPDGLPLVELLTVGSGHTLSSSRIVHTVFGVESRYSSHELEDDGRTRTIAITVAHERLGLRAELRLSASGGIPVVRSELRVTNVGATDVLLRGVTTLSIHAGAGREWTLHHGRSEWLAEGRWGSVPIPGAAFPEISEAMTHHDPRGVYAVQSTGTWSTGEHLPTGVLESAGAAWAWQVEHNGAWRWEVGRDASSPYFALSGPTDSAHQFLHRLAPGQSFQSVPGAAALGRDLESAVAALTRYRRSRRRPHPDNASPRVVYNDYMNTLGGDPTTAKLEPLIDAAASAGAEVFCIDAGWYADDRGWWRTVGAWEASTTRFPGGFDRVIERIRSRGMIPGLWLEPEVVGIESPLAEVFRDDDFLTRGGRRIVEHGRYHLDLRSSAVRAHLDGVIDRLVEGYGLGYLKLDYNINPGGGSDRDGLSPGDALLEHNRAHLRWLDGVLERHPDLILENCASGAMRADAAMLERLPLQSTSDQQDYLRYPPIAASAPLAMLPEQAANWAYPQAEMTPEAITFCLVNGLAGRLYLSGRLDLMSREQLSVVAAAVEFARGFRRELVTAVPFWPMGIPGWDDPWVALGLATAGRRLLVVWNRDPSVASPALSAVSLREVFPLHLASWNVEPGAEDGTLRISNPTGEGGARLYEYGWSEKKLEDAIDTFQ